VRLLACGRLQKLADLLVARLLSALAAQRGGEQAPGMSAILVAAHPGTIFELSQE
jgi:hypothetical protein